MSELSLEVQPNGSGEVVVVVAGEVDLATAPDLDACLCNQSDRDVVVDLSAVPFLDSTGISALVHARNVIQAGGHTLRVTGEQDIVRTVLSVAGLLDLLHGED